MERCLLCNGSVCLTADESLETVTGEKGWFFIFECLECGQVFEIIAKEEDDEATA